MQIAVVGTGYVGLVSGVCLAEVGHTIVCVDTDAAKVEKLKNARSPIYEPGLDALLKRNIEHERLSFTTRLKDALRGATAVFIAVGTPQGEDGSADLQYVLGVAEAIGKGAENDMVVIVKSTVPVGTCDRVEAVLEAQLKARGGSLKLCVASNPEFLKEGSAIEDFMRPDRIVAGAVDPVAADVLREMYRPFILDDPSKLFIMDRRSSELTKYGANAMLATRISFMNELSRLCDKVGANVDNIRLGMGLDPRIGRKFLYAGPGYGGSCFPKDVAALLRTGEDHGVDMSVLKAVTRANEEQKLYVADKVKSYFDRNGGLEGSRIALWGLAFKPGTDDVREAPAKTVARHLLDHGATIVAHDPEGEPNFSKEFGPHERMSYAKSAYEAVQGADALVLLTEWSEYRRPNFDKIKSLMRGRAIFDLRNQYGRDVVEKAGFFYECVGRPSFGAAGR
jgi:UDPglucose 6-dehydrogenase